MTNHKAQPKPAGNPTRTAHPRQARPDAATNV